MSINRVMITGNLTRDAEIRATQSGTQVANFGVAVNDRRRNQQGNWEDVPNFIDCVLFGARAQALSQRLLKGQKVAVEGKLRYSSWQAQDGQRRSKIEVVVDDIDLLAQPRQQANYTPQPQMPPQQAQMPINAPIADEYVPF